LMCFRHVAMLVPVTFEDESSELMLMILCCGRNCK
jgi:hypothetical protein